MKYNKDYIKDRINEAKKIIKRFQENDEINIIDELTMSYKPLIEHGLSDRERKILINMTKSGVGIKNPIKNKDLALQCRIVQKSEVSMYTKRLKDKGIVKKTIEGVIISEDIPYFSKYLISRFTGFSNLYAQNKIPDKQKPVEWYLNNVLAKRMEEIK